MHKILPMFLVFLVLTGFCHAEPVDASVIVSPTVQKSGDISRYDLSGFVPDRLLPEPWDNPICVFTYKWSFINAFEVSGHGGVYATCWGGPSSDNSLEDVRGGKTVKIDHPGEVRTCYFNGQQIIFVTDGDNKVLFYPAEITSAPDTIFFNKIRPHEMVLVVNNESVLLTVPGDELIVAESFDGHEWLTTNFTGRPLSFGGINPTYIDANYYQCCNLTVFVMGANGTHMAICIKDGKKVFTQIFASGPHVGPVRKGLSGRPLSLLHDGKRLMIAFANGDTGELSVLYNDSLVLLGVDDWVEWSCSNYDFGSKILCMAHNPAMAAIVTELGVYTIPLDNFYRHLGNMFDGGSAVVDTLKLPNTVGPITGVDVTDQNDIYISDQLNIYYYKKKLPRTSVDNNGGAAQESFKLHQNYPNPFNPMTTILFDLLEADHVVLNIFNSKGQLIAELINNQMPAGGHSVDWVTTDQPSGVYFYQLKAGSLSQTRKMMLVK